MTHDELLGRDYFEAGSEYVLSTTKEEYEQDKEAHDFAIKLSFETYKFVHFPDWKDSNFKILQHTYPDGRFVLAWYTLVPAKYLKDIPETPVITSDGFKES